MGIIEGVTTNLGILEQKLTKRSITVKSYSCVGRYLGDSKKQLILVRCDSCDKNKIHKNNKKGNILPLTTTKESWNYQILRIIVDNFKWSRLVFARTLAF